MKPPYAIGSVSSLSGHAIAYRWRSLPRVRRHRASKPQGSFERVLPWQITMDQLIFASLSHTHYWYEVGMRKVPASGSPRSFHLKDVITKGNNADIMRSIEATLRRGRILFAGFVVRMEDTRLPKCVMFGEMVGGADCVGGQEKEWMECFLDDLTQSFRHQRRPVDDCSPGRGGIAAQNGRTRGGTVVCPNVTGRTKETRLAQSKRARAGSLALVDKPQVARTCILRAFGLQIEMP